MSITINTIIIYKVLFEKQLRELVEAPSPALPFVSGVFGNIEMSVESGFPEGLDVLCRIAAPAVLQLAAAVTYEYELVAALYGLGLLQGDGTSAEYAEG